MGTRVRVLLAKCGKSPLAVRVEGTAFLHWRGGEGGAVLPVRDPVTLSAGEGGVSVLAGAPVPAVRFEGGDGAVFGVGGRTYRGDLVVRRGPGADLEVVNEVDLETYLLGVVGGEMPPSWEIEALKAQAVAARTYAAARKRAAATRKRSFDLYDDTRSQVYVGVPERLHRERIERAVRETRDEVLVHGGRLLNAFFHSTCGGHTESAFRVFHTDRVPPLKGVPCAHCSDSPAHRWEAEVPREAVESILGAGALQSVRGEDAGPSGRAGRVTVEGAGGKKTLEASDFRREVGYRVLKSTAFEAEVLGETVRFKGRGYGHGVGLCQWGARGLARSGKEALDILDHYYPGALVLPVSAVGAGE
jgi:stage II sporulation protein D